MKIELDQIKKHIEVAKEAISKESRDVIQGDMSTEVATFINHHLEEIEKSYWIKHTGKEQPTAKEVAELLIVKPFWLEEAEDFVGEDYDPEEEDCVDVFRVDITLPDEITNYLLCVQLSEDSDPIEITLES